MIRRGFQVLLGLGLGYAGIGHLTTSRQEFQAQVPNLLKDYADFVVVASGVVEIVLGVAVLVGSKSKLVSWSLLSMIVFFTFLKKKQIETGLYGYLLLLRVVQLFTH